MNGLDAQVAELAGIEQDEAYAELCASWRYGDGLNNARAMLKYAEYKRDTTRFWRFIRRWGYHGMVASAEAEIKARLAEPEPADAHQTPDPSIPCLRYLQGVAQHQGPDEDHAGHPRHGNPGLGREPTDGRTGDGDPGERRRAGAVAHMSWICPCGYENTTQYGWRYGRRVSKGTRGARCRKCREWTKGL